MKAGSSPVLNEETSVQLQWFLEHSARQLPEKTALVCGDQVYAYRELDRAANHLAHGLIAAGVQRGDRVAMWLDNGLQAVLSVFAVLKAGAVILPVNPTTKSEKLAYLLNHSRASALILPGRKLGALESHWPLLPYLQGVIAVGTASPVIAGCGKRCVSFESLLYEQTSQDEPPATQADDADLAAIIYTSGSTGNPKGVMLTHRNVVSAVTSVATYLENRPEDVIFSVLPLSFGYGLLQLLTTVKVGATLVLEKSFTFPHAVLDKMARQRATGLALVPTISAILVEMDLGKYDFSQLRYVTNAGAAWPTEHIRELRRRLPHVRLYSMYGLTECLRASYLAPEEIDRRPASIGRGMPGVELCVVDPEGRRVGPGVVGELVVRGPNVMQGYWELPEETGSVLRPGPWPGERVLYTGDLFRTDEEGYLSFVGRKDDLIKSRGEKVSPREVENALYDHPAVAEAAVIGVPDAVLGQAIRAIVALKAGRQATPQELLRHCAGRLEDFMVPQSIELCESLPKSANGKIDKRQLSGVK